jgi:hypothetical protein
MHSQSLDFGNELHKQVAIDYKWNFSFVVEYFFGSKPVGNSKICY